MLTVLGGLAEFERELISAGTGEGRARANSKPPSAPSFGIIFTVAFAVIAIVLLHNVATSGCGAFQLARCSSASLFGPRNTAAR
jgi:hypothetical protein